ncbi:MAG: sugar transferase [Micromonosporaceae bacterium]|nr:sugar transferase [Micromonosporaceae bacterium]
MIRLVLLDLLIGLAAASAAWGARFGRAPEGPYREDYLLLTCCVPFAWLGALAVNRAYELRRLFVGHDEYDRVVRSGLTLIAAFAIVSYSLDYRLARGYLVLAVPLATACAVLGRYALRKRLHRQWGRGERLHRVILVGHEQSVLATAGRLGRESYHGLGVVGACLPRATRDPFPARSCNPARPTVYGDFERVAEAVAQAGADTVIVLSCPEIDGAALRRLAWQLEHDDIDLIVASSLVDVAGDRTTIRPMDGMPLLHIEHAYLKGVRRIAKEVVDRIVALLMLVAIAPLLLAIVAAVRLSSAWGDPVIFRQQRIGKDGRPFQIYKFRTMYVDAEARLADLRHHNDTDGTLFKMRDDPRVTPVGRVLRRWSLDELPQLFNVMTGDMSLVGPRPPLQREVAQYPADMRRRLVVKPGLTGLWQVSGRSDLSWEESIRLDLSYVENWSLTMDLVIMLRTLAAVLRRSGAY